MTGLAPAAGFLVGFVCAAQMSQYFPREWREGDLE